MSEVVRLAARGEGVTADGRFVPLAAPGDTLTATGEVVWSGHGALPGADGWVSLHTADQAPLTLPEPQPFEHSELHQAVLDALEADRIEGSIKEITDKSESKKMEVSSWFGECADG